MSTKIRTRALAVLGALAIALGSSAAWAAGSVTGTWLLTVTTQAGTGNPTFELSQDGDKITGKYNGALGEAPLTGTVDGDEFTINFTAAAQGNELKCEYKGKIAEDGTIAGTLTLGQLGDGTFTGKKQ